jgi:hypothetical protein
MFSCRRFVIGVLLATTKTRRDGDFSGRPRRQCGCGRRRPVRARCRSSLGCIGGQRHGGLRLGGCVCVCVPIIVSGIQSCQLLCPVCCIAIGPAASVRSRARVGSMRWCFDHRITGPRCIIRRSFGCRLLWQSELKHLARVIVLCCVLGCR